MIKEKFTAAFEEVLAANRGGEVKNLLITDNNPDFLDDALYALRSWAFKNGMNLVELDERDDSWLPEIQSRELFDKLNQPNTVLLIKNYATVNFYSIDENTPRKFLQDAVVNRHYGCGNDFYPSDELTNLLFVIALNDLTEMSWREKEYSIFKIIHNDETKKVWTNTNFTLSSSRMHPVMSAINKVLFWVSDDETTLCFEVDKAFKEIRREHPARAHHLTANDKTEIVHAYIDDHLPDFNKNVTSLMLKTERDEHFVIDSRRLRHSFPKLGSICCKDNFEIADIDDEMCVLDPFDLGEMSFNLALDDDIPMANAFVHDLWALDPKWARFFREVAKDYYRKSEDRTKVYLDSIEYTLTGMDHLFHIYWLGWYHLGDDFFDESDKVYVNKHENFDKALELLPGRFQNCDIDEIAEKLYWDIRHVENDSRPGYHNFDKILSETERLFPGVQAKMCEEGWLTEDVGEVYITRTCNMCGKTFDFWDHQENFCFDRHIGFGSVYDLHCIKLNLCCHCFDKVMDWILPQCRHKPVLEIREKDGK